MATGKFPFLISSIKNQALNWFSRFKVPLSTASIGHGKYFTRTMNSSYGNYSSGMPCLTNRTCTMAFGSILNSSIRFNPKPQERELHLSSTLCVMGYKGYSEEQQLFIMHHYKPKPRHKKKKLLDGNPQMKGVVLKTLIKKPKKPNSANRKCVLVRLSNGKEAVAYVPGEGHSLQEHNIVLVRNGRVQDVPGLKLKVIRGKYDCGHVIKKKAI